MHRPEQEAVAIDTIEPVALPDEIAYPACLVGQILGADVEGNGVSLRWPRRMLKWPLLKLVGELRPGLWAERARRRQDRAG